MWGTRQSVPNVLAIATLALCVGLSWLYPHPLLSLAGGVALLYLVARGALAMRRLGSQPASPPPAPPEVREVMRRKPVDPADPRSLVENMLAQGRFAILLRPQIAANLDEPQFQQAIAAMEEAMALVPDGEVVLDPDEESRDEPEEQRAAPRVIRVEHYFLDRYPVTNRQFYEFVVSGGYQQPSFWEPSILPAVLDFVDQTGQPGPRFWKNGCYEAGLGDHPVVGISWYEAAAYARWVGKRLPTDAEWVKAASWPVSVNATSRQQRRFPWGDTMDRARTNLWGSGPNGTVPVTALAEGASVGGVYQLVGNVWEWMRGNFAPPDPPDGRWAFDVPMKSLRGGAYNTYFDNQATCQFGSGDAATARKPNIGFRCAVGVCDLVLSRPVQSINAGAGPNAGETADEETLSPMEVGV